MMDIRISVIIPIYNGGEYIEACLNSVLDQNLQGIEIICVDDGSDDQSLSVLENYQRQYNNIILLRQKHKGLSAARNAGLEIAQGEYVYFVDIDDQVKRDFLRNAYLRAKEDNLDVLLFSFEPVCLDDDLKSKYKHLLTEKKRSYASEGIITGMEMMTNLCEVGEYHVTVWIQLTRRQILEKNRIRFYDGILFEDNLYTLQLLRCAKRCRCITDIGYFKGFRKNSICTSEESADSVYGFWITLREIHTIVEHELEGQIRYPMNVILGDIEKQIKKRYNRLKAREKDKLLQQYFDGKERDFFYKFLSDINISIVVPVFNAALYLSKCIKSLIDQTYQEIEIILVNDGSYDDSSEICHSYEKTNKNIIVLDQEHQGPNSARLNGVRHSRGAYVAFCDSDDWVEPDYIEQLKHGLDRAGMDCGIVMSNLMIERIGNKAQVYFENIPEGDIGKEYIYSTLLPNYLYYDMKRKRIINYALVSRLFEKNLLLQAMEQTDMRIRFNEDGLVNCRMLKCVEKVYYTNYCGYHYVSRKDSLCHTPSKEIAEESEKYLLPEYVRLLKEILPEQEIRIQFYKQFGETILWNIRKSNSKDIE